MDAELKNKVENKVVDTLLRAKEYYGREFEVPAIEYKDMGRTAGRAFVRGNRIVLSPTLLQAYPEDFIGRTVPHEIAHLVTGKMYPFASAHGMEWRKVMHALTGEHIEQVARCHSYDTTIVPNRRENRKWEYTCECGKLFQIGAARHRRAQQGAKYRCRKLHVIHPTGMVLIP